MLERAKSYFLLESPVLGGSGTKKQVVLFTGVVAGAVAQWGFDALQNGTGLKPVGLLLALIASVVTFPLIFQSAGLNKTKVNFVKWCVAFQNGFFWPTLLSQVTQTFQSTQGPTH